MFADSWTSRERSDSLPGLRFRLLEIGLHLQTHPELRGISEPVGKPERRIASDSSLAIDDLSNPIRRDAKLACQFSRRHANGFQSLCKNFTRWLD